jgi:hypothetical protein
MCACGCRRETKGGKWIPGDDGLTMADIFAEIGDTADLLRFVERHIGRDVPRIKRPEVKR